MNTDTPVTHRALPNIRTLVAGMSSPPARIHDVAWIAGSWHAEAFGGLAEEIWSQPMAGTMMGMYRLISGGELSLYELMSIAEVHGSLVLRVKHFDAALKGWEEKDESMAFPLVELTDSEAYFDGLTFRRISDDELRVFLRMRSKEGEVREQEFVYRRVRDRELVEQKKSGVQS